MAAVRKCDQCGEAFEPLREHARFCSPACRIAWNGHHVTVSSHDESALDWAMAGMADTVDQLAGACGLNSAEGSALVAEAVWRVTMADATVVRYHQDSYGRALEAQSPELREATENTLAGLRFVRNYMRPEADCSGLLSACSGGASAPRSRVAAWRWKAVAQPPVAQPPELNQEWELSRYEAFNMQLADHLVGDTFAVATAFVHSVYEISSRG